MKKAKRNLLISLVFVAITLINYFFAKQWNAFFFRFYPYIANFFIHKLSVLTSFVPFSLWEFVAFAIILYLIVVCIISIKRKEIVLYITKVILVLSFLATAFVNEWGLNYFSPTLYDRLGYVNKDYSIKDLYELTNYLALQANKYALRVQRDEDGRVINNIKECNETLSVGFTRIQEKLPFFNNTQLKVKKLVSSKYFSLRGITGIFICLTGESSITDSVYPAAIPFTMAHEICHRNSIAREDEANFLGFLACINHSDDNFIYSGYFEAFLYCASELIEVSEEAYQPIKYIINEQLRFDILDNYGFYQEKTDEQKEKENNEFYNSYLETFEIENGMDSYNDMVQLLLCWYFENR